MSSVGGRSGLVFCARKYGGMTLVEIGEIAEGANYPAVGQTVKRFERLLKSNTSLQGFVGRMGQMLNVQT